MAIKGEQHKEFSYDLRSSESAITFLNTLSPGADTLQLTDRHIPGVLAIVSRLYGFGSLDGTGPTKTELQTVVANTLYGLSDEEIAQKSKIDLAEVNVWRQAVIERVASKGTVEQSLAALACANELNAGIKIASAEVVIDPVIVADHPIPQPRTEHSLEAEPVATSSIDKIITRFSEKGVIAAEVAVLLSAHFEPGHEPLDEQSLELISQLGAQLIKADQEHLQAMHQSSKRGHAVSVKAELLFRLALGSGGPQSGYRDPVSRGNLRDAMKNKVLYKSMKNLPESTIDKLLADKLESSLKALAAAQKKRRGGTTPAAV